MHLVLDIEIPIEAWDLHLNLPMEYKYKLELIGKDLGIKTYNELFTLILDDYMTDWKIGLAKREIGDLLKELWTDTVLPDVRKTLNKNAVMEATLEDLSTSIPHGKEYIDSLLRKNEKKINDKLHAKK